MLDLKVDGSSDVLLPTGRTLGASFTQDSEWRRLSTYVNFHTALRQHSFLDDNDVAHLTLNGLKKPRRLI